tara:strand:+ start:10142 stop:10564 length:423 start_codon:yes stop_codon:yes gene_type:complete
MSDKDILELLRSRRADFLTILGGEVKDFNSSPPELKMQFDVGKEFCHSGGKIIQGGFITVMLDAPMAHLVIGLLDFKINPITLDINVSFLKSAGPGRLLSISRITKLGRSTGFLASDLFQGDSIVATATSTVKLIPMDKS